MISFTLSVTFSVTSFAVVVTCPATTGALALTVSVASWTFCWVLGSCQKFLALLLIFSRLRRPSWLPRR